MIPTLLQAACVVLPPTSDPPAVVPPIVHIEWQTLKPSVTEPVVMDLVGNTDEKFNLVGQVVTTRVTTELKYYWYYDFNWKAPTALSQYTICFTDKPSCDLQPCTRPHADDTHQLMVVVSSAPLKDNPLNPFDFPDGSVYDMVAWDITLKNQSSCSQP